ncbi:MAG: hypothetical protein ACI4V3_05445 [Faecousia sp.]
MATNCDAKTLYKSLGFCKGTTILPGIRTTAYVIPKKDIVKWPTLPEIAGATDMAELATYKGDFVLESDKKWLKIDLVDNKGKIECESQGDKPARTFLNKITLSHPESDAAAAGFARQANSDDLVYLIQRRNGKFRVLGNEMFDTDTKPKQDSGEGMTGDQGTTLEISVTDMCPAPYYVGKIETEDGDISGETGLPIEA